MNERGMSWGGERSYEHGWTYLFFGLGLMFDFFV